MPAKLCHFMWIYICYSNLELLSKPEFIRHGPHSSQYIFSVVLKPDQANVVEINFRLVFASIILSWTIVCRSTELDSNTFKRVVYYVCNNKKKILLWLSLTRNWFTLSKIVLPLNKLFFILFLFRKKTF